jgi:uroporphyrinogen-III decarboxylase
MAQVRTQQEVMETSVRRIWGAYRGEKTDRIPISPPISWSPDGDIDAAHFGDWRDEESFRMLARLVQEHCDLTPPHNAVACPRVFEPLGYQRFLEAPGENVEALPPERVGPIRTRYTTLLHTPKGDLSWVYDADDDIFTTWDIEKPIRSLADVDRMLSVPYQFTPPDPSAFEPFRRHRAERPGQTLGGSGVNSMVACLCGMMSFQLLLEWVVEEPGAIHDLAAAWLERTGGKVDYLLSQGVGPFWHFNGVERASPPMMGPRQWEEWVVPYDGELMRRLHAADPEARIHVHCHGRVGTLLDSFLAMGVDSIDPVEPPTQGDITFAEARRRVGDKMVLYGNIEFVDMETRTPDEIESLVRQALEEGGPRTVLTPSATPHERLNDVFVANAVRYLEAAVKYGS